MTHILHITSVSRRVFLFFFSLFPVFLWMFLFRSQYVLANLFFKKFHLLHLFCVRLDFSFFFLAKDRPVAIKSFCRSWRTKIASIKWSIDVVFFSYLFVCFFNAFFRMAKILIFLGIHKIYVLYYNILEFQNDKKMWTHTPTIDRSKSNDAPDQSKCVTCTQFWTAYRN